MIYIYIYIYLDFITGVSKTGGGLRHKNLGCNSYGTSLSYDCFKGMIFRRTHTVLKPKFCIKYFTFLFTDKTYFFFAINQK